MTTETTMSTQLSLADQTDLSRHQLVAALEVTVGRLVAAQQGNEDERDNYGFSNSDLGLGRGLLAHWHEVSLEDELLAFVGHLLLRYSRTQLSPAEVGAALAAVRLAPTGTCQSLRGGASAFCQAKVQAQKAAERAQKERAARAVRIEANGTDALMIRFPYEPALVDLIKTTFRQRRFDSAAQGWVCLGVTAAELDTFMARLGSDREICRIGTFVPAVPKTASGPNLWPLGVELTARGVRLTFSPGTPIFRPLLQLAKAAGGTFNSTTKVPYWLLDEAGFGKFATEARKIADLDLAGIDVALTALTAQALAREAAVGAVQAVQIRVPAGVKLFGHQDTGIRFLMGREQAMLADDPGLGKTLQAILAAENCLDKQARILVLCPLNVVHNWATEIRRWLSKTLLPMYSEAGGAYAERCVSEIPGTSGQDQAADGSGSNERGSGESYRLDHREGQGPSVAPAGQRWDEGRHAPAGGANQAPGRSDDISRSRRVELSGRERATDDRSPGAGVGPAWAAGVSAGVSGSNPWARDGAPGAHVLQGGLRTTGSEAGRRAGRADARSPKGSSRRQEDHDAESARLDRAAHRAYGRGLVAVASTRSDLPSARYVIVTYDSAKILGPLRDALLAQRWDLLILDEAHRAKNCGKVTTKSKTGEKTTKRGSGRWDIANQIRADRKWMLTGTPMQNRPMDLLGLLRIAAHPIARNKMNFGLRYCNGHHTGWGWDFGGASNLPELSEKLSGWMLRREKTDVLDLPEKFRVTETVGVERRYIHPFEDIGQMMEARRCLAVGKIGATAERIEDLLDDPSRKVIVFSEYIEVLDGLEAACQKLKVGSVRIDGSVTGKNRHAAVDRFQTDPACRVFIGQTLAAGEGITLTAATYVIFNDLSMVPAYHAQAEDRAYRIGQKNQVTVTYMLTEEDLDQRLWAMLQAKLETIGVFEGGLVDPDQQVRLGAAELFRILKEARA